jgi:N-methylhydantoinase A
MEMLVGVDIGGTFTDIVLMKRSGDVIANEKVLTTPEDPAKSIIDALAFLKDRISSETEGIDLVIHATTLVTNTIIQRSGAKTGFLTTQGFRDVLEIGRERRADLYDIFIEKPSPLVPRRLSKEVKERISNEGEVISPLDEQSLTLAAKQLLSEGVESIGICFIHSYRNPEHEKRSVELIRKIAPNVYISASSEVAPEIREYERASTTTANAYVQPKMHSYLSGLSSSLATSLGHPIPIFVMLSSGGIIGHQGAEKYPVRIVESGPAAGALASSFLASLAGETNVVSFDMGGTTAKMCLIRDSKPRVTDEFEVARVYRFKKGSGLPLKIPSVELIEIGAGGGSIAYIDRLGLLSVGPQSSEAVPGPACYGRGGTSPTVTDADLLLGYLSADNFLGGRMKLDTQNAERAVREQIAEPLEMDITQAAWGVFQTVTFNMVNATKVYSAELGTDIRDSTLIAFGGAGPVHACSLAEQLGIEKILIPLGAGVTSAFGLLVTPPAIEMSRSFLSDLDLLGVDDLKRLYADMEAEATTLMKDAGIKQNEIVFHKTATMRYVGQTHEISVDLTSEEISKQFIEKSKVAFNERYRKLYHRSDPSYSVEAVTWRLSARGPEKKMKSITPLLSSFVDAKHTRKSTTSKAYFPEIGGWVDCASQFRSELKNGFSENGPMIIHEDNSTIVVRPSWNASIDQNYDLVLKRRN